MKCQPANADKSFIISSSDFIKNALVATSVKRMKKKKKRMFVRRIGFAEKGWNCFCKVQQDSTFRLLGAIGGG